jgi:hypothetical protein
MLLLGDYPHRIFRGVFLAAGGDGGDSFGLGP